MDTKNINTKSENTDPKRILTNGLVIIIIKLIKIASFIFCGFRPYIAVEYSITLFGKRFLIFSESIAALQKVILPGFVQGFSM